MKSAHPKGVKCEKAVNKVFIFHCQAVERNIWVGACPQSLVFFPPHTDLINK